MISILKILSVAAIWLIKSSSLPKIYFKIQFTREPEVENQLAFLDVHITKTREGVETKIFRKPAFTGLYNTFITIPTFTFITIRHLSF